MTFVASWVSVELAAASCSLQLAASNLIPLSLVMTAMLSYHALIGIGEGLGTCLVFSFLLKTRPDILTESLRSSAWKKNDVLFLGIGVAVFLVWFVLPFASSQPDGLEKVASEKGFQQSITELFHSVLPNYALPGVSNSWLASTIAALAGIGVILTVALIIRRLVRAKK
jgi:cobalt/nickel transport system permease protein